MRLWISPGIYWLFGGGPAKVSDYGRSAHRLAGRSPGSCRKYQGEVFREVLGCLAAPLLAIRPGPVGWRACLSVSVFGSFRSASWLKRCGAIQCKIAISRPGALRAPPECPTLRGPESLLARFGAYCAFFACFAGRRAGVASRQRTAGIFTVSRYGSPLSRSGEPPDRLAGSRALLSTVLGNGGPGAR